MQVFSYETVPVEKLKMVAARPGGGGVSVQKMQNFSFRMRRDVRFDGTGLYVQHLEAEAGGMLVPGHLGCKVSLRLDQIQLYKISSNQ